MESLKLSNLMKTYYPKKTAVIHISQDQVIEEIIFETLFKFVSKIKSFLLCNIREDNNVCIGLLMDKNVLVPAIIISFQELNYCFMFLTTKSVVDSVNRLNIKWILTIDVKPSNKNFCLKEILKLSAEKEIHLWINENYMEDQKHISFQNIFCVVQTSGSTGENKSVHVPHACIESNVISLNKHFRITNNDVIYWGTPLTFDPTLIELILGILQQATLVIVPKSVALNPTLLYHALFKIGSVTFLQLVPSVFLRWNKQQISEILLNSSLKILALGGEPFPLEILDNKRQQSLRLFNLYGITELSCWATIADLTHSFNKNEAPLGITLDETFIQVTNENEEIILEGVGEICIGSHTRRCLVNDNEQSTTSPFIMKTGDLGEWKNGNLYYRGRKTRIIKRYGHRVILHKLENTIFNETGLLSRLVYSHGYKKLLAFVLIEEHFNQSTKLKLLDKLKVKLLNILPDHGFPDFLDVLTHFPLNGHGKICDKLLEKRYQDTLNANQTKQHNADDIFLDVLSSFLKTELRGNIDHLGQHTFFELGGNSILAVQFLQTFEEQTCADSPGELITLLLNDTIHACLTYVRQHTTLKRKSADHNIRESKALKVQMDRQDCVIWKRDLKGCVDSPPVAFKIGDRTHIAVGSFAHVFAIFCENGEEYLKLTLPQEIEGQPSISSCGSFLFIGCANGVLYSISLITKQIAWEFPTSQKIISTVCVCATSLVFGSYDGYVYCLTIKDGELCWKTELLGSIRTDPIYSKDLNIVYVGTTKGVCYALNKENGTVIWNYKVDAPIFGSPCIVRDCIIWPSVIGKLYCISTNGDFKWSCTVGGHIFSSLKVKENVTYFGCHDSFLYKIKSSNDEYEISKITKLESETSSSPFLYQYKDKLFVISVCNIGILYVIDGSSNNVVFRMRLPAESFSSPFVFDNKVYIGCRDNKLYCINIEKCLIT